MFQSHVHGIEFKLAVYGRLRGFVPAYLYVGVVTLTVCTQNHLSTTFFLLLQPGFGTVGRSMSIHRRPNNDLRTSFTVSYQSHSTYYPRRGQLLG